MAQRDRVTAASSRPVIVRAANGKFAALLDLLFSRYPEREWASFLRFGWRDTPDGLVLTLADFDAPEVGDLEESVDHVAIQEPYTLRIALASETHPFAVGIAHSHPLGYRTYPSVIDDDMDAYYSKYFADFSPGRPYPSLIFARRDGKLYGSGRVHWRGTWHEVQRFLVALFAVDVDGVSSPDRNPPSLNRVARLISAFGAEAAERLRASTVGVVGASGSGSPAIEILARAGVGRIITVDPDHFTESNLERVHGSEERDIEDEPLKAALARRHINAINSKCDVVAIRGRVPQYDVVNALLHADVVLGCTDKQHSRLALADLAIRYLVPVIDCGVNLEGADGQVTGQIIQAVRFFPGDPCPFCRDMIIPARVAQELMSPAEREQRRAAAREALERGDNPDPYWLNEPQLNTVGYLTTIAGALIAGYAIGLITRRFGLPFTRLQMDLSAEALGAINVDNLARPHCTCGRVIGWNDQGSADALVSAPSHWARAQIF